MRIGALCVLVGLALVLTVPAGALAGTAVDTPQGHAAADNVVLTPSAEAQLSRVSAANNAAARATVATVTGTPDVVGQWGPVVDWPVVAINAALLPNGKVLAYDSIGDQATETYPVQDHTRATVWDPVTASQTAVTLNDGYNIFCSGFSYLANGNIFIAGGNKDQKLDGIVQTHYFNGNTNTWSLGVNMAYARWYPTVTALGNGEMLITSGGPAIPEVRQSDGTLRTLSNASLSLPLYPWFDVAPDGRAFDSGPDQTMRSLDPTGAGAWQSWSSRDTINRDYGSHAMYDIGKILVAGGGPSTNTADVINLNGATPTVTPTGSMAYGRRQNNLTVLADGTVLVTGGNSSGAPLVDLNAGVYAAELWNPATGQWTTLSSMQVTRQYHSTALLLPDGRVLSAGGGICGTCDTVGYLNKNAEIFSPPYLFAKDGSGSLAPRPTVTAAPGAVAEGYQFTVSTPDAASISKVALVKLGAVTHSNNMDQRYVPLSFTAGNGTLTVTAPANVNIAPPGYYMLFIVNSAGVPSVAPILNVVKDVPPAVQITAPASGSTFPLGSDITINATASDSDGGVQKVEFFAGTTKLGESTTAPYSFLWHPPSSGTYALTARATDNAGVTTTSATDSVGVANIGPATITVPPLSPTCADVASRTPPGGGAARVSLSCRAPAGAPFSYAVVSPPVHGTLSAIDQRTGSLVYVSRLGYHGSDRFTYRATDASGASNTATSTIAVPTPLGNLAYSLLGWKFTALRAYTKVLSMIGTDVPLGTKIMISCQGRGCPFTSRTVTASASGCKHQQARCRRNNGTQTRSVDLTPQLRRSRFVGGTGLTVSFIKTGFVGKVYIFQMRPAKSPTWSATCLAPGSLTPGRGC
jgi:hypothetical protein